MARLTPTAKAVVYGVLVDLGGSIAAAFILTTLYAFALAGSGMSQEEVLRAIGEPEAMSWFSIVGFLSGSAASFLGGYVCARVAARGEMRPVGIVAAVSGVASLLLGSGAYAFEWNAVFALVSMATVAAGGWVGRQRNLGSAR